jgi:asparagine synthase (glutamine-hydrolysing)
MCGITGIFDIRSKYSIEKEVLTSMADAIRHRGPDEASCFIDGNTGFGFRRLSIIDLAHGHQPYFTDDQRVRMICNGEIYNYKELRHELQQKGYRFSTNCDVEVVLHGYLEHGAAFIERLQGQFAIAVSDARTNSLLLARDQFGICPLFYTVVDDVLIFGSEIKSLLRHPAVKKEVDITGLDQVFAFPGPVSPTTLFKNINSLKPGHFLQVKDGRISTHEYWDLDYHPEAYNYENRSESSYVEELEEILLTSIRYRLNADVPVGFYLSGGLDSSLIAAMMKKLNPDVSYQSFSIGFPALDHREIDERKYQQMVARHVNSRHTEIAFDWPEIEQRLRQAIYYAECPLKETYNTCSLALSAQVQQQGVKVILSGEGSDELLGGYVGYRFDVQRSTQQYEKDLEALLEDQMNEQLWGDANFIYEKRHMSFRETVQALYSDAVNENFHAFDCLERLPIDKRKLHNRHPFHRRSYLDMKLRLSDHLIADHGDRVAYANSIEGRYPFLDVNLAAFVKTIPPEIKLKNLVEKYILKEVAKKYLPTEIFTRQKQGFVAPGSPHLLRNNIEWINDMLSYDRIRRQGYFNPDTIERLKKIYRKDDFKLNLPFDSDLLIVVLTFNIFLDVFDMPDFSAASYGLPMITNTIYHEV